jgi:opacity protein-like surface antigen
MRTRLLSVLMASLMIGLTSTAIAQDEIDPEGGELGEGDAEIGGEAEADGSEMAPAGGDADKPISVGLLLGYGISLEDGGNPWGVGFGLRGGYNIDAIYLGVRFVYYLGDSEGSGPAEITVNVWELGVEGGYDVDAGGVIIRPGLGLGIANVSLDSSFGSASESEFFIAPGVSLLFDVTDSIFIGADARFKVVLSDPTGKAITLLANAGMRF